MLSAEQIETFFRKGFVLQKDVFSHEEIALMRLAFERLQDTASRLHKTQLHRGSLFVLHERDHGHGTSIDRVVWCGGQEPVLRRYGTDPRLLRPVGQLLGSTDMVQLINQAHFKLPRDGVAFSWHQDSTHRRYSGGEWRDVNGRGSYVQTLTAIDDMTEDNGPLEVIPGSCGLGHVELTEPMGERTLERLLGTSETASITMSAGSVLFVGPYTFHRSLPNQSDRPRRVLINGFAFPGANKRLYPGAGVGRLLSSAR